jgi:2-dehydro-3-deoxyphosphooctonate aldolase (KDO 8-P synthase)
MRTKWKKELMGMTEREKLLLIAGPCVIEDEGLVLEIAQELAHLAKRYDFQVTFKASYDKANRSSYKSFRGPGLEEGLRILEKVKAETGLPILSDVHEPGEVPRAAEVLDVLQIPAFLCRQTDLLLAAAKTGKTVNVKKGQFLAPWDMKNVVDKLTAAGCETLWLTERGASFGYNNLVVDFRSFLIMREWGHPVIFDATHSVQLPGAGGDRSSGQSEFVPHLARAAVACGVEGLFIETHPDPGKALSDGPNMVALGEMESLLAQVQRVREALDRT